jgi:hypothetical protein
MSYEFSDARWWHDRAQRFGELSAQRAKEFYPGLFNADGSLRPWSWEMRDLPRDTVPPKESAAYRRDKVSLATKGMAA